MTSIVIGSEDSASGLLSSCRKLDVLLEFRVNGYLPWSPQYERMMRTLKHVLKILSDCDLSSYYDLHTRMYGRAEDHGIRHDLLDAFEFHCSALWGEIQHRAARPSGRSSVKIIHEP